MYEFLTEGEHMITVRNRETGRARRSRYWNKTTINHILENQKDCEDVFVTKYPKNRLIEYLILDFDSKDDKSLVDKETRRLKNQLQRQGHNVVIVDSTNKGKHVYIQLAPILFKDNGNWQMKDWDLLFRNFQDYFLKRSLSNSGLVEYTTLDPVNSRAGLNANIRLIDSIHPSTGERVHIIDGDFHNMQLPTKYQDFALRTAYHLSEIIHERKEYHKELQTKVVDGNDPIANNDLREIFPAITGDEIKLYSKGYGFIKCPFHNDNNPSLLVTKEFYSCASCSAKGNIFTLQKKGLVKFTHDGKVIT